MAAVRQLAGERKGLGSGAQSARQANSLLANLQAAGVDRAALAAAAAAAAAAAIRVVGAPSPPPPLSLSGLALRGEAAAAGADGAWADDWRPARCTPSSSSRSSLRRTCGARSLAAAAAVCRGSRRKRAEQGAEVRISGASYCWCVRCSLP